MESYITASYRSPWLRCPWYDDTLRTMWNVFDNRHNIDQHQLTNDRPKVCGRWISSLEDCNLHDFQSNPRLVTPTHLYFPEFSRFFSLRIFQTTRHPDNETDRDYYAYSLRYDSLASRCRDFSLRGELNAWNWRSKTSQVAHCTKIRMSSCMQIFVLFSHKFSHASTIPWWHFS